MKDIGATMKRIGEGTWFAVPLRSQGYAVGLVARTSASSGVVLAYFFLGPWPELPQLESVVDLRPGEAARVLRIGDLGLINGSWPILGAAPRWERENWPMPMFIRRERLSARAWLVEYSDRDPNVLLSETVTDAESKLERSSLLGYGAAEAVLTRLASEPPSGT